jgi:nicotinamidase-related amidase
MNKALVVIDYTWDFVANEGKLTCGKAGQAVERRIAELTKQFVAEEAYVVMAVDVHDVNDPFHPETKLFPPHNIRGTEGRGLFGKLNQVFEAHKEQIRWMDKTRYSAFAGTDLEMRLQERGVQEVHLAGVCTDICVLHTAVDAYNKGFQIVVHQDAVQSFNPTGHEWALGHFRNTLGAKLMADGQETS